MLMSQDEFKNKLGQSFGMKLIMAGIASLVDDEGKTPLEAFEIVRNIEQNTFHALNEMKDEGSKSNE